MAVEMAMELQEIEDNGTEVPSKVQCPECENEIPVDPDWQEGEIFTCPSCSVDIQVTGTNPFWVDFAPENDEDEDEDWEAMEGAVDLSLDEVEDMEDENEEELDDDDDWSDDVHPRVSPLRVGRARPRPRKNAVEKVEEEKILLTPEGVERLRQELNNLETVRLPKVTAWLSEALSEGFEEEDVTELEEARSELSLLEGRVRNLRNILAAAEVLKEPESKEVVQLGSRVTVAEGSYEPETYRIVTPPEADPLNGFISNVSPLGKALIDRHVGDTVVVKSPDGPIEFRILEIH
ncbi:MAG: GreA/GreB family elongation factor [Anaerolineales bacterium]|nr:GreA/GreB family elongation factor [Anaerolineales bacterium]